MWWWLALLLLAGASLWWWKSRQSPDAAGLASSSQPASGAASGARAGGAGGAGAGSRRFGGANRVQPVSVQAVRRQDIRITVNAIGTLTAANTAVVRPQVSGLLQSIVFTEGQQVKAGQVLAQIDPRAFQAALLQAEGALARDQAQLVNANVDLTRYRDLVAKDAAPRQQLDTQEALVRQLEGTVKVDQAAVQSARLQVSYARVTAPIAGRVGLKQADLGNVVSPGDTNGLVSITQTRPIALVFAVPSANLPQVTARLRERAPLVVEAWDRGGSQLLATGQLATADNAIDASTDTIKLKALFPNQDDALFPNQSVSVRLQLATLADSLAVPQAAVLRGAQGFYVYVVKPDNTVATVVVKTGAVDSGWMAVEAALQPGQRVVVDGTDRLREGAPVEVIANDPQQRAGANAPPGGGRRGQRGAPASGAASSARSSSAANGGYGAGGSASAEPAPHRDAGANAPGRGREVPSDGAASGASQGNANGERPRWLDRVPPEMVDKLKQMSPDERREWLRAHRPSASGPGGSSGPASPPAP